MIYIHLHLMATALKVSKFSSKMWIVRHLLQTLPKHFYWDVTRGRKGGTIPRAPNHCGDAEMFQQCLIVISTLFQQCHIVISTLFNTLHLLRKYSRFEYGGAKLASCPGRHLTSLRTCTVMNTSLCHTFHINTVSFQLVHCYHHRRLNHRMTSN